MVKKSLIAIALLAFLATTVQAADLDPNIPDHSFKYDDHWPWTYTALPICCIDVYMDIGYYVSIKDCDDLKIVLKQVNCSVIGKVDDDFPCYYGCTKFKILTNFPVKLGTSLTKVGDVIDGWEASFDDDTVPGDAGDWVEREICISAWKAKIWTASPGDEVLVGTVCITVKPNA